MKKRMGCKADDEVKYRSNLMVVRISSRSTTQQMPFYFAFFLLSTEFTTSYITGVPMKIEA